MIEQLHNDIVKQIVPPKYQYTAQVSEHNVRFNIDKKIDLSHIDTTDPLVKILVENCISVRVNDADCVCEITPYQGDHKAVVMDIIGRYFCRFLKNNMKQKNPEVTKLYKWVQQYSNANGAPTGSENEYMMLYKYLNANIHNADSEVHIKNGIGILNTFKVKYEARGYETEVRRGRRRRRNRW